MLRKEDISKYNTLIDADSCPRQVLKKACRFPIRKNISVLFNTFIPGSIVQLWREHWLYYAARSAIWEERIKEYCGKLDVDTLSIKFNDDNDDEDISMEEQFYNLWNYEPDEQSLTLQNRIIGSEIENMIQLDIRSFCEKYGAHVPMRKLKIKK